MRVWRLVRSRFAQDPYGGAGAALGGGRWNSRGLYVAYAAWSRSLAMLELLVHVARDQAPDDLVFVGAEIPDDAIQDLNVASLPEGWRRTPPPLELRAVGDAGVRQTRTLALRVPSAIVPQEHNLLINPEHPQFRNMTLEPPEAAFIDARLIR